MVSTKLAAVHSPTIAPNHSKRPGARGRALRWIGSRRVVGDVGRQAAQHVGDGQLRVLALAEQMRDRGGEDEEREQRERSTDKRGCRRG